MYLDKKQMTEKFNISNYNENSLQYQIQKLNQINSFFLSKIRNKDISSNFSKELSDMCLNIEL